MKNQKYILNKPKYFLSSLIGILIVTLGFRFFYYVTGGKVSHLLHLGELFGIFSVTLGVLFFAYRTAAFKPWLTAFGIGVPQEEETIKVYIRICDTTARTLLFAGAMIFFAGICNTLNTYPDYFDEDAEEIALKSGQSGIVEKQVQDTQAKPEIEAHGHPINYKRHSYEEVRLMKLQATLTAPILSLFIICALVLPTRAKLAFLLDEQSLNEARLRKK